MGKTARVTGDHTTAGVSFINRKVRQKLRTALLAGSAALSLSGPALAEGGAVNPHMFGVCFTPGADCTGLIADQVAEAKREVLVQAYGFTSPPIIKALTDAAARGVSVKVILDKSNETDRYSGATFLANHGVTPLIDDRVAIAHNKVIVIDGITVITGSFNFTKAAQARNAENVLIVSGKAELADFYSANWNRRAAVSRAWRGMGGRDAR